MDLQGEFAELLILHGQFLTLNRLAARAFRARSTEIQPR